MTLSNGSHIAKGLEKIQKRKNYHRVLFDC